MSFGGAFYALTEDQLKRVLSGSLDGEAFLKGRSTEKPAECYSSAEQVWYELTKLLASENGCGAEATEVVPEGGAYSYSPDVRMTAEALTLLTKNELRSRYASLDTSFTFEAVYQAVIGLVSFYRRADRSGHAVLFNIC